MKNILWVAIVVVVVGASATLFLPDDNEGAIPDQEVDQEVPDDIDQSQDYKSTNNSEEREQEISPPIEEADLEALKKQYPNYCENRYNSCLAGCATIDEGPDNWGQCDDNCGNYLQVCLGQR